MSFLHLRWPTSFVCPHAHIHTQTHIYTPHHSHYPTCVINLSDKLGLGANREFLPPSVFHVFSIWSHTRRKNKLFMWCLFSVMSDSPALDISLEESYVHCTFESWLCDQIYACIYWPHKHRMRVALICIDQAQAFCVYGVFLTFRSICCSTVCAAMQAHLSRYVARTHA